MEEDKSRISQNVIINKIFTSQSGPAVIYISNANFSDSAKTLYTQIAKRSVAPFSFIELQVNDWDTFLTPWSATMNNRSFEGRAGELLDYIKTVVLKMISDCINEDTKIYIAGYSLAGLFSLWSIYESNIFDGAVCCSASLWYPGWNEYVSKRTLDNNAKIYLSLGRKEKNTKNKIMKNIEENMLIQYEKLKNDSHVSDTTFVWHDGGHFTDTALRVVSGICWVLEYKYI